MTALTIGEKAQVVSILEKAKTLIDTPEKWTTDTLHAVDVEGYDCFCALGAIGAAACDDPYAVKYYLFRDHLPSKLAAEAVADTIRPLHEEAWGFFEESDKKYTNVYRYNDDLAADHNDVIEVFDDTIARLKKEN